MYAYKKSHRRDTQSPAGDSMEWHLSMRFYRVICESNSICPLQGFAYPRPWEYIFKHTLLRKRDKSAHQPYRLLRSFMGYRLPQIWYRTFLAFCDRFPAFGKGEAVPCVMWRFDFLYFISLYNSFCFTFYKHRFNPYCLALFMYIIITRESSKMASS